MGLLSLVLAHLVFVLPYVFLSLSDPWRAYDRRYETVAAGLGKGRLTTLLHVRLPMLLGAILTAAAVGFAVSIGQYLPTLLIGAGRLTTITTEAVALASGGNRRVIGVFAFLQMALPALGFLVATGRPRADIPQSPRHARLTPGTDGGQRTLSRSRDDFARRRVLVALTHRVAPGEVLTVMGPSGSGKSTLLAYVGGFLDRAFEASGRVSVDGVELTALPPRIAMPAYCSRTRCCSRICRSAAICCSPSRIPSRDERRVGDGRGGARWRRAGRHGERDPDTLSGGQKARVALARRCCRRRACCCSTSRSRSSTQRCASRCASWFSPRRETAACRWCWSPMTRPTLRRPAGRSCGSETEPWPLPLPDLPVKDIVPDLLAGLAARPNAVLIAPPGAGKTTLVPLALLGEAWARSGRILLLEPRRLAARAAARRMAALLGEEVGATVGYAMRMDSRQSAKTRVLVVTEGILARMILDEPDLPGIAAILFDEFHERSLDGDFGLALALDVQAGLRPDLRLARDVGNA